MSLPEMMAIGRSGDSPRRSSAAPMRLRQSPALAHKLSVRQRPSASRCAEEHAVGRGLGPMLERLAQLGVIGRQHLRGADMDDAARLALQHGIECAQPHRAQAAPMCAGTDAAADAHVGPRVTLGARFSRKSLSRAFASPSACAIADISASTA